MVTQGKDILSSDLDIFGEGTGEETQEVGTEFDIFGGAADLPTESTEAGLETPQANGEQTEAGEGTVAEETKDKAEGTTEATEGQAGNDEILDVDIENLFADIEQESKDNPDLLKLVDTLRDEVSAKTTENNILQKENTTLNEKLMSRVGDDSNLGIYKSVISNLESNPKLMMLVKHIGNSSSDTIKSKLVGVVTDILFDLTGEDVSDLINKDQSAKIMAATGKSASGSVPTATEEKDENMNYEESISRLF